MAAAASLAAEQLGESTLLAAALSRPTHFFNSDIHMVRVEGQWRRYKVLGMIVFSASTTNFCLDVHGQGKDTISFLW